MVSRISRRAWLRFENVVAARGAELLGTLPDRYRRLAERVWLQLPDGFDSHADWEIVAGRIDSTVDIILAAAALDESDLGDLQRWRIVLCTERLDSLAPQ